LVLTDERGEVQLAAQIDEAIADSAEGIALTEDSAVLLARQRPSASRQEGKALFGVSRDGKLLWRRPLMDPEPSAGLVTLLGPYASPGAVWLLGEGVDMGIGYQPFFLSVDGAGEIVTLASLGEAQLSTAAACAASSPTWVYLAGDGESIVLEQLGDGGVHRGTTAVPDECKGSTVTLSVAELSGASLVVASCQPTKDDYSQETTGKPSLHLWSARR
jgi:hypothetical protein